MDNLEPQPLPVELEQENNLIDLEIASSESELETPAEPSIRVVHLLFVGLVVLFAVLRLPNLERFPLSPVEAENAFAVWAYWQPSTLEGSVESAEFIQPISPAYFSMTALTSQLFGYETWAMRIVPILASMGALLLLYLYRQTFGWITVLTVGLLLAVSPTFLFMSREAGGNSLAVMALIGGLGSWLQYRRTWDQRSLLWMVGFVAFGLTTDTLFISGLLIFIVTTAFERLIGPPLQSNPVTYDEDGNPQPAPYISQEAYRPAGITALIVFLASSTLFLWNLAGLGNAFDLFSAWIGQFGGFFNPLSLLDTIFALGRYELIPFVSGALIAAWGTWQNERRLTYHAYWFASAMLLLFAQGIVIENVFLLALPSYFIIGQAFQNAVESQNSDWFSEKPLFDSQPDLFFPLIGVGTILFVIGAVNFGRYARTLRGAPLDSPFFYLVLFSVLMLLFLIGSVYYFEPASALSAFFGLLVISVTIFHWGIGWRLAHLNANDPRERWVNLATDQEVLLMENTLREVGRDTLGIEQALSIFSTVDHPVMRWYLREFPDVAFGDVVPIGQVPDVVITYDGEDPSISSEYTGTDFGLVLKDSENILNNQDSLRWWLFGDSPNVSVGDRVILWVRIDLINETLQ